MSNETGTTIGCQPVGCITFILAIVAIWALCFGVTIDGKHYGLSDCSCNRGVVIDK